MTNAPTCLRCARPMADTAYIDDHCGRALGRALGDVVRVAGEAQTTVARLDRIGDAGRRSGPEPPLPYRPEAAEAHRAAVLTLLTWARHVSEERGIAIVLATGAHPEAMLAQWLQVQVTWLRHRPEADEAFDELHDACHQLERVVDRPADRWYAGRCGVDGCEEDLYPVAGASAVTCRACGCRHDLDERKAHLLVLAEDVLAGASWCAATLTRLGVPTKANTVVQWSVRGRILAHGDDVHGHPVYRLGDVRELAEEAMRQDKERTLRAAVRAAELAEAKRKAGVSA